MNIRKLKLGGTLLLVTSVPVTFAISCASSYGKMAENPFFVKKINIQDHTGDKSKTSSKVLIGTLNPNASSPIPKYWGFGRKKDISASDSFAPAEYNSRRLTGAPKSPVLDIEDAWNWSPEGTVDGVPKAGDNRIIASSTKKSNDPDIEMTWGPVDGDFNRATVREIQPRMFGEKLKPTQSSYARYSQMNWNSTKNGNNDIGILGGRTSTSDALIHNHWQYTNDMVTWGGGKSLTLKMPTGAQIDTAHRNGVPIIGVAFMYLWGTGESGHDLEVFNNPGPNGDFPLAKGMVELADYYGFDGWMVDWEAAEGPKTKFLEAWNKVAHAPSNKANPTEIQKKYNYYHKPQLVTNYGAGYRSDLRPNSDIYYTNQNHGNDVDTSSFTNSIADAKLIKRDKYYGNIAQNYPEDLYPKSRRIIKGAIDGSIGWGSQQTGSGRKEENRRSQWMYSYFEPDNISLDEGLFSSTAGDPRYSGKTHSDKEYAVSDGFQERTSIIGRKNWTTTFDFGSGNSLNFFGFNDINNYTVHTNESGWKDTNMQSYLPTYRWIVDEYNSAGTKISDINTLVDGHVKRKVTPYLNNETPDNWMGGTNISYKGAMSPGEYFENKLFASAIPVETGDKFTIKIKNGGQEPDLLVETKKTPGVLNATKKTTTDDFGDALITTSPILAYSADSTWNFAREKKIIKPVGKAKPIGKSGWSELTYDLSSLNSKTITSFGIKATATPGNTDFSKLKLGEMHFEAHDHIDMTASISNLRTTKYWNNSTSPTAKARIKWDETTTNGKLRNYFVFYADDNFNVTNLAWEGANPVAYLDRLDKSKPKQNLIIMGIDDNYRVVLNQSATIKLK